jgi:hypothetical protein
MRTNEELYDELTQQALDLLTTHEFGSSRKRTAKLRETIYLMDAHAAGQDITLAKLAYNPDEHRSENPIASLRQHLGAAMPDAISTAIDVGNGYYVLPRAKGWVGGGFTGNIFPDDIGYRAGRL